MKRFVAAIVALCGLVGLSATEASAMPVSHPSTVAVQDAAPAGVEQVQYGYRGGYGYGRPYGYGRGYGYRRGFGGYRRPYGYRRYGFRRPYAYGYRRPYGYGPRRFYGY